MFKIIFNLMKNELKLPLVFICGILFYFVFINSLTFDQKSRASYAKTSLNQIKILQDDFYNIHHRYAKTFEELGWKKPVKETGPDYYKYIMCNSIIEGIKIGNVPIELPSYLEKCSSSGYFVYAIANLDNDEKLDIFLLSDKYGIVHISDDSCK